MNAKKRRDENWIAATLRGELGKRQMSLSKIAQRTGVAQATLSEFASGKDARGETLSKLAAYFGYQLVKISITSILLLALCGSAAGQSAIDDLAPEVDLPAWIQATHDRAWFLDMVGAAKTERQLQQLRAIQAETSWMLRSTRNRYYRLDRRLTFPSEWAIGNIIVNQQLSQIAAGGPWEPWYGYWQPWPPGYRSFLDVLGLK